MTTCTESRVENQLNELFKEAVKLSQSDKIWDLYGKAEGIEGLDSLIGGKELKSTVLDQGAVFALKWLNNKINSLNGLDLETTKGLFFMVGLVSNHSDFWSSPRNIDDEIFRKLVEHSKKIVSNVSSHIYVDFLTNYHEEERRDYLKKIVADNDWSKIYNEYHRNHENFERSICFSLKGAFTLLYYFDVKSLMSILDIDRDIPFMWGMMGLMGKSKAMGIALETTNQTLKFCALASVLPFSGRDSLTKYESDELVTVFLTFMKDENLWRHWMKILNTYPSRYPHIQMSLGKALALTTSDHAIQSYFKAIYLYTLEFNDIGRQSVSECLESFSQFANDEKQIMVWKTAFEIWHSWDFGIGDKDGHLFEVKASALDYAVTRYYLDCYDSAERKAFIEELIENLNNIDNVWHQTSSKHITYWYLQHSKFQPLHHAEEMSKNDTLQCLMQGVYQQNYGKYKDYIQYMIR